MGTQSKFENNTLTIRYVEDIAEDRKKIIKIYKENSFIFARVIKNLKNLGHPSHPTRQFKRIM